jgi:hypothetical protein
MAALLGTDGDGLYVFMKRSVIHFTNRSVMRQMYHLRSRALKYMPHHVDGGIVPVKQTGRRN